MIGELEFIYICFGYRTEKINCIIKINSIFNIYDIDYIDTIAKEADTLYNQHVKGEGTLCTKLNRPALNTCVRRGFPIHTSTYQTLSISRNMLDFG